MAAPGMKEKNFEDEVVAQLVGRSGYQQSVASHFDLAFGLDPEELGSFLGATQLDRWKQLVTRYGGDEAKARRGFASRVSDEIGKRGTLDALRTGVKDQGLAFELAYFKPASSMNQTHQAKYAGNRLSVTRQLRYSPNHNNTIDLGLLVNGILVATAELKNPLTGQTVDHALAQYRADRDPKDPVLRGALVHFAVDPYLVYMTTKLAKHETEFLPFNRGDHGGKGNPAVEDGYATSYLWEQIWERHAWLDIIHRFIQKTGQNAIFPRFHQWDAVTRLEADARKNGAGQRYLVQHSAGSGKSNSIAWLAHRLSNLYDQADNKVFDKVIVITDRRILDEQLRANVQGFEKVKGTVVTILGEQHAKSHDLTSALTSPSAKIVVTTIQVFPFLLDKQLNAELAKWKFAVIVDEAHSSQTGDAAHALRQALGSGIDLPDDADGEDALNAVLAARGDQHNLSFFAFTATPKMKTVELFGTRQPDGAMGPFHLYSMRQAIEEQFIMDVLKYYTTYKTYFRLAVIDEAKSAEELDASKASSELRKAVVRDPDVISQKARIMVEHFRAHTAGKIGGEAKAMVVTDSRVAAVRYKRAFDVYIADMKYAIHTIVAFSGTVSDDVAGEVTESSLNGFPDTQTASRFQGKPPYKVGDYQVLIVAEKFQTGFDEPLLHTMFVDKTLTGLNTVQTLSRLNRMNPEKSDTFVLDFRNDPDAVRKDFERYYEATTATPTKPNDVTDAHDRLYRDWSVMDVDEVRQVVARHFSANPTGGGLGAVYAAFTLPVARFSELTQPGQADFRTALERYITLYSFMSQVLPWTDLALERTYVYSKALAHLLPRQVSGSLEIGTAVALTHLRIEAAGVASIELTPGGMPPGKAYPGEGGGRLTDPRYETLAAITDALNDQFGLNLTDRDRLMFQQFEVGWLHDEDLKNVAQANNLSDFRLEFERTFKATILDNEAANQELYKRIYSDAGFAKSVLDFYLVRLYQLLRGEAPAPSIGIAL